MFDMNRMCKSSFNKKKSMILSMDHLRRLQHLFELETENYLFHSAHSILIFLHTPHTFCTSVYCFFQLITHARKQPSTAVFDTL